MRGHTGLLLLVVSLAALPLIRGGYLGWPQAVFGVVAGVTLMLAPRHRRRRRVDVLFALSLALWGLWLSWQLFQWLPLPMPLLESLAPASASLWQKMHSAGIAGSARISLLPDTAMQMFITSGSLFCFYLAVRQHLRARPQWRRHFLFAIIAIGSLQAVYGTLAHLSGLQIPWLEPAPPAHIRVAHGSFPNRNHFAAFLIPCIACALALVLGQSATSRPSWASRFRRWMDFFNSPTILARVAMLVMVVAVVLSQSRMGNAALALGISVFGLIWLLNARNAVGFFKILALFLSIAAVDVLLVSERFGLEQVIQRLEETDLEEGARVTARQMSWALIKQFGMTGAGHGSFSHLEHTVRQDPEMDYLHHAHNDHLELVIEFGWIGYGILACLLTVHLGMAARALRSRRSLARACAAAFLMVCAAALLHATVEYLFHIPGWRALFVGMMALMASFSPPGRTTRATRVSTRSGA